MKVTVKNASWRELLRLECEQRTTLVEPQTRENIARSKLLRDWWNTVEEIFRRMVVPSGTFTDPLPMELFSVIAGLAGYLSAGQVPEPISGVRTKGRTSFGPTETRHIQTAVTYHKAVSNGLIGDSAPTQTIKNAYGVRSARTIQEWCRHIESADLSIYAQFPEALTKSMLKHGQAYKRANQRTWDSAQYKNAKKGRRAVK